MAIDVAIVTARACGIARPLRSSTGESQIGRRGAVAAAGLLRFGNSADRKIGDGVPMIPWLAAEFALGLAAAFIARAKGRDFLPWLIYGAVLSVVAIPHALMLRGEDAVDDHDPAVGPRHDGYPPEPGDWAAGWMRAEPVPGEGAPYSARGSHGSSQVFAVWSDDAFARIARDGSRRGAGAAPSGMEVRSEVTRQDASFVARRPVAGDDEAAHIAWPEMNDDAVANAAAPQNPPKASEPGRANGYANMDRDVLDLTGTHEAASIPPPDADRTVDRTEGSAAFSEPRFDTDGSRREGAAFDTASAAFDDASWVARRFAPEQPAMGRTPRRSRNRSAPGHGLWLYAGASLCATLAIVALWPRLADFAAPPKAGPAPPPPAAQASGPTAGASVDVPSRVAGPADVPRPSPQPPVEENARTAVAAPPAAPPLPPPLPPIAAAIPVPPKRVTPPDMDAAVPPPAPRKSAPKAPAPKKPAAGKKAGKPAAGKATGKDDGDVITAAGQMVVLLQAELKKRGYDPGQVDGRAGEKTRRAIRAFKRKEGIGSNSDIDPQLLERLGIVGKRLYPFASALP